MSEYTLEPLGWRSWSKLPFENNGWTWLWYDLEGAHVAASLPTQQPVTSHFWGWQPNRAWARLRLDTDRAVGAILRRDTSGGKPALVGPIVESQVRAAAGGIGLRQVGNAIRTISVLTPACLAFVEVLGATITADDR